jgi:hypothetical protein
VPQKSGSAPQKDPSGIDTIVQSLGLSKIASALEIIAKTVTCKETSLKALKRPLTVKPAKVGW